MSSHVLSLLVEDKPGLLTRVALISNPILQQLRAMAAGTLSHLPAFRQRMVDQMTEVDLHYPDSPLTQRPHGAIAARPRREDADRIVGGRGHTRGRFFSGSYIG